ncbi:hypothetical protein FRB99_003126 [Tulasnella sp. 403]|nr:hypothetical protein FRB99_003126 [Tulasnella sp. 403]
MQSAISKALYRKALNRRSRPPLHSPPKPLRSSYTPTPSTRTRCSLLDAFDFLEGVDQEVSPVMGEFGQLVGVMGDGQKTVGDGKGTFEAVEIKLAGLEKRYGRQNEVVVKR